MSRPFKPVATFAVAFTLVTALPAMGAVLRGTGFTMPSKLVTCAYIHERGQTGLYCSASYIRKYQYDGMGVVMLPPTGPARYTGSGNDVLLLIGGWKPSGGTDPRPTLHYGVAWAHGGYACRSLAAGVDCSRGGHGFHLSKERIRLY
jgi:hypothetical protein